VRLLLKRLVGFTGLTAGLSFSVLFVLRISTDGQLLGGSTWKQVIRIDGAVWIVSIVLLTIMEIEQAFALRRAAETSRWGEPVPWNDRSRRARIASVGAMMCFVVALILGFSSFHRFQLETWLLLSSSVLLLAYASVLRTEPSAPDGPNSQHS
jgi:hypothetical protein